MITALVLVVLVLVVYIAVKKKIQSNDLKKQLKEYDENSYS